MCHTLDDYINKRMQDKEIKLIGNINLHEIKKWLNFLKTGPMIELNRGENLEWNKSEKNSLEYSTIGFLDRNETLYVRLNSKDKQPVLRFLDKNADLALIPGLGLYMMAFTDEKRTSKSFEELVYVHEATFNALQNLIYSNNKNFLNVKREKF